jgi:hypothetical protein
MVCCSLLKSQANPPPLLPVSTCSASSAAMCTAGSTFSTHWYVNKLPTVFHMYSMAMTNSVS